MTQLLTKEQYTEYERFVQSSPKGHFTQSTYWAKQKPEWDWEAIVCRNQEGQILGTVAILIRKLPGMPWKLAYACRGPVCDPEDTETLAELMTAARQLAYERNAAVLKLDPDISIADEAFAQRLHNLGFRDCPGGTDFDQIQPKFVFRLDLRGKDEASVFAQFHQKTRYNIRVAEKKGVTVQICGEEYVQAFSEIMAETGHRDGFVVRQPAYFKALLRNFGDRARLYMAFFEGQPIAGTLAIQYGDKTWYLYGASSNANRDKMPNYLLQWEMIRWALAGGCSTYDFRGVSGDLTPENPLYGLYRFKKGFSGDFTEFVGEKDMVLRPIPYAIMRKALGLYGWWKHRKAQG